MLESPKSGFTIVELLVTLMILGMVTTFTVSKILVAQQNVKYNAVTKEAVSIVVGAFQRYKLENAAGASTGISDLTPYMNYALFDTISTIDDKQTQGMQACNGVSTLCIRLHNGAVMRYAFSSSYYFGATDSMHAVWFDIDPDGTYSGTTNTGKAVEFWLYYDGRVSSYGTIAPNTCLKNACNNNPIPAYDPPWFSW